jgi:hypothetical protein
MVSNRIISALALMLLMQEQPPRPAYPQRTADRLYGVLGQCNADLMDLRDYARELNAALDLKDKEIAELKANLSEKEKKPDDKK